MGDGVIDLRGVRGLVEEAGYDGPIEVEVINPELMELAGDELLALVCERSLSCV
jgi:sugar phosphate isomerase/epimerase